MKNHIKFKDHMEIRATTFEDVKKATIGLDFAVFEFNNYTEVKKALKFAATCNNMYNYTFDCDEKTRFVTFNS